MIELMTSEDLNFVFATDNEGYLHNQMNDRLISQLNHQILNSIKYYCGILYGEKLVAIYFRGSKLISSYKSDFHIVVIVSEPVDFESRKLSNYLTNKLSNQYFHIEHFDAMVLTKVEALSNRHNNFIIKVLCVLFWGENLGELISRFKPNGEINFHLNSIDRKEQLFRESIYPSKNQYFLSTSNFFIKYLLLCSFELIIDKEKVYTRSIALCYSYFLKHYPQHTDLCTRLYKLYNVNYHYSNEFYQDCLQLFSVIRFEINNKNVFSNNE